MTSSSGAVRHLPRAAEAVARAERMYEDLTRYQYDTVGFRDRIPYVFELLRGATRIITEESKGKRTQSFASWWHPLKIRLGEEMKELRDAELKKLESRTAYDMHIDINALASNYPDRPVNDGDTVTTVAWVFVGGSLDRKLVLPTLKQYLDDLKPILMEAETRLGQHLLRLADGIDGSAALLESVRAVSPDAHCERVAALPATAS